MAFSMSRAWSDAIDLGRDRWRGLLAIILVLQAIGLAVVLPVLPLWIELLRPGADPQVQAARMMEALPQIMGISMLANIVQLVGFGAMFALLGSERPTIGKALLQGLKAMPTMFISIVFLVIGFYVAMLGVVLVVALCAALFVGAASVQPDSGAAMAVPAVLLMIVLYFATLVGMLYFAVRFVALLPIIAIERVYNPFTAIARAWRLTRHDAWKLVGLWVLVWIVATIIVMTIVMAVAGSLFQIGGPPPTLESLIPLWLTMIPLNIAMGIAFTALVVATYVQLAEGEAATHETPA